MLLVIVARLLLPSIFRRKKEGTVSTVPPLVGNWPVENWVLRACNVTWVTRARVEFLIKPGHLEISITRTRLKEISGENELFCSRKLELTSILGRAYTRRKKVKVGAARSKIARKTMKRSFATSLLPRMRKVLTKWNEQPDSKISSTMMKVSLDTNVSF